MASKTAARGREKGTGTISKIRNRFYLIRQADGRRKSYLLRNEDDSYCTTRAQAEAAAARMNAATAELDTREKYLDAAAEIRQLKTAAVFSFSAMWEAFLANPNRPDCGANGMDIKKRILDRFAQWCAGRGTTGAADVTPQLAGAFMEELGREVSNNTFNEYLQVFKMVFAYSAKAAGLRGNPFDGIRRRPGETISRSEFTAAQVRAIFNGFRDGFYYEMPCRPRKDGTKGTVRREYVPMHKDQMEVLFTLCCYSGADGESGCLMTWDNVDLDNGLIRYVRAKTRKATGGRATTLPIHPDLRAALVRALEWRRDNSPYVLPDVAERYSRSRHSVQADAMKIIRLALGVETTNREAANGDGDNAPKRKLGANIYSLHSFRHTFVSFCANAGVPEAVVAAIVGHGSPAMTRHYEHISGEAKARALAALPMLAGQLPQAGTGCAGEAARMELASLLERMDGERLAKVLEFARGLA